MALAELHAVLAVLAAALVLDRLFGEPAWLWSRAPHPVVVMGRLVVWLDIGLNRTGQPDRARRLAGALAVALLVALALAAGLLFHWALARVGLGLWPEALIVAILLSHRSLLDHGAAVAAALEAGDLDGARKAVARIVGRDVAAMDEAQAARAAVESVAEGLSDGVVAPAFWYVLLGLPGLLAYKAVNTADSMIGHRTPRHRAFGSAAARLDDALNVAPARLTALLIALAALPRGGSGRALRAAWRDAARHVSPNAGWPEGAAAGALDLALGGPRAYGGRKLEGAWLHAAGRRDVHPSDLRAALRLADAAWAVLLALTLLGFAISR